MPNKALKKKALMHRKKKQKKKKVRKWMSFTFYLYSSKKCKPNAN